MEIIVHPVNNHCPAQNFTDLKSVRYKRKERLPANTKQRRHIPRVLWVWAAIWVIMPACARKTVLPVSRTFHTLMDMKSKNWLTTWLFPYGQPFHLRRDHDTTAQLIKPHNPADIWVLTTPLDTSLRICFPLKNRTIIHHSPQSYICFIICGEAWIVHPSWLVFTINLSLRTSPATAL